MPTLLEQPDTARPRSPYRYRITGYTRGRPDHPSRRMFNTKRDKLFFFWNQEYTGQRKDYGTRFVTMPTAARAQRRFLQERDRFAAR